MVKAHSLLYAIYVCLIVSLLCGALLYITNMYSQLNLFYVTHEELYIHNQSLVNYALGNIEGQEPMPQEENTILADYSTKQFGLFTLLLAKSFIKNDTITSAHFAGQYAADDTCIYLANYSKGLSYSGNVTLNGKKQLPSLNIEELFIDNQPNSLTEKGEIKLSINDLPALNSRFKDVFGLPEGNIISLKDIEMEKDSLYYNSFTAQTKMVRIGGETLGNIIIKGNFVLYFPDSVYIKKSAVLEDVIIHAPKVTFEDGFSGTVQVFATKGVRLGKDVSLLYPSALCLYNETLNESAIIADKNCRIYGGVVMFGFPPRARDNNAIEIKEGGLVVGDIYCQGKLSLNSNVYGSVYTNRFLLKTRASSYDNCIANIEINVSKRPDYFISLPLFPNNTRRYGLSKKVM